MIAADARIKFECDSFNLREWGNSVISDADFDARSDWIARMRETGAWYTYMYTYIMLCRGIGVWDLSSCSLGAIGSQYGNSAGMWLAPCSRALDGRYYSLPSPLTLSIFVDSLCLRLCPSLCMYRIATLVMNE